MLHEIPCDNQIRFVLQGQTNSHRHHFFSFPVRTRQPSVAVFQNNM